MHAAKQSRSATKVHLSQPGSILRAAALQTDNQQSARLARKATPVTRVSNPQDAEEQEADASAERVMRMAQPRVTHGADAAVGFIARNTTKQTPAEELQVAPSLNLQRQPTNSAGPTATLPATSARNAEPAGQASANVYAEINAARSAGQPLPLSVRRFMEPRFNADFSRVKVHTDQRAAQLNKQVNARAFAYGRHVFFAQGQFQPDSEDGKRLLAHELTHTIQQGAARQYNPNQAEAGKPKPAAAEAAAPVSAPSSRTATGSLQRAVHPSVTVSKHTSPKVQRLGVSDALDYFADKAYFIPGFRLFALLLGLNPINMSRVLRSAANLMRALVEFLPGGRLITLLLDKYGIFTRVANWVNTQLDNLGITASSIRAALMAFINSLSFSDIFNLSAVWQRAKRIFTQPIARILQLARSLLAQILVWIKQAILLPLAQLAARTPGWRLLCAVIGRNPITKEPVARNPETLIGGFMHLIGQQQVWENIKKANAVARAWAWFQQALAGLIGLVAGIPARVSAVFAALRVTDLLSIPAVLVRVGRSFVGFALRFSRWAARQVVGLLRIVVSVLTPGLMPFLRRAGQAFTRIITQPVAFVGHLVRAVLLGFKQFATNILQHLSRGIIGWLMGALSSAGVYIPSRFSLFELVKFVFSVLGVTRQVIRAKLVRVLGERAVGLMERGFALVKTLLTRGPMALWQQFKRSLGSLRTLVLEQIMNFVAVRIIQAAVVRIVSLINPAGAFIQAVLAIYNTVQFFIQRMRSMLEVANSVLGSIVAIVAGKIGAAAAKVEQSLASVLTLVISFMARLLGLGNVSRAIINLVNRVRRPVDKAIDKAIKWLVTQARRAGRFVAQAGLPRDANARRQQGLNAAKQLVRRLPRNRLVEGLINRALGVIKTRYGFASLQARIRDGRWWIFGRMSPQTGIDTGLPANDASTAQLVNQMPDKVDILDQQNVVRISNYSRQRRAGDVPASTYTGGRFRLNKVRYSANNQQVVQSLGPSSELQYTLADAGSAYIPPRRIVGIVDSANPEEARSYNAHRKAFAGFKRRWWKSDSPGGQPVDKLIEKGWVMADSEKQLKRGEKKWRYIHDQLFTATEKDAFKPKRVTKANMLHFIDTRLAQPRREELSQRWLDRIGQQTEIHHLLPLDFGGTNTQVFIPVSRDRHTKNSNSIHLAFWNPLKRWLVGLRSTRQQPAQPRQG